MIGELFALEEYMGRLQAVWPLQQLIDRFGFDQVSQAMANQWLEIRTIPSLTQTGEQTFAFLSDIARHSSMMS
jgi:hypothetical protein